jgi:hypothetical protein
MSNIICEEYGVSYRNLHGPEDTDNAGFVLSYTWEHKPTRSQGVSRIAILSEPTMTRAMHALAWLLIHWNNKNWSYRPC